MSIDKMTWKGFCIQNDPRQNICWQNDQVSKTLADKMIVDKVSVDKMNEKAIYIQNDCRWDVCRQNDFRW